MSVQKVGYETAAQAGVADRVDVRPGFAEDLPLGVEVDALSLEVAPYFRSGMVVEFPIRVSRQALLTALQSSEPGIDADALYQEIQEFLAKYPSLASESALRLWTQVETGSQMCKSTDTSVHRRCLR